MELQETGWQAPRRSRRPQGLPDPLAWPLQNWFAGLPEEAVEEDSAYSQEYPKLLSRPQKTPVVCETKRRPAVVSHLGILGMPFLEKHQCHMDFQKWAVVMAGKELACVDKFGRPLVGGVQVVQDCTIPGRSQATLRCRVNCKEITDLGVVEGTHGAIRLANSLNWLDCRKELLVQCINPFAESVRLSAGVLVGKYHSIQETDVGPALETVADSQGNLPRIKQGAVPKHVADLYGGACNNCTSSAERQELAQLLMEYSDVFSRGNGDMGLTKVISHEIPLTAGTTPI